MKLTTKLSVTILILLFLVCMGMYLITVHNERNFFIKQLNSNAQDTATSLGLSISQALAEKDKALMLSMVQAVFDRGYFRSITIVDVHGKPIVSRHVQEDINSAPPQWFKELMPLSSIEQKAVVMSGWRQVGKVEVQSDPSWAYLALWKNAKALLYWYIIIAILALIITYFFVRWLLYPLRHITRQAIAICKGTFPVEKKIPSTPEFRQVTEAMNRMVLAVREIFEQQLQQIQYLQKQNYSDSLTGLGNRRIFLQQIQSNLQEGDDFVPGYLILVAIDGLDILNKHHGYTAGDDMLKEMGEKLTKVAQPYKSVQLMRISGSQFGIIVHYMEQKQFEIFIEQLNSNLQNYFSEQPLCKVYLAAVGLKQNESSKDLLSRADQNLGEARNKSNHLSFHLPSEQRNILVTRELMDHAFHNKEFVLFSQIVKCQNNILHKEIFVRLQLEDELLHAGYFMSFAEKEKYATAIDCYVLDRLVENIDNETEQLIAINISGQTILDEVNRTLYLKKLEHIAPSIRKRFIIEINELYFIDHFDDVLRTLNLLDNLSVRVAVDHVGAQFSVLGYIKNISIEYLKVDGVLLQDIMNNDYKQFYIHYFNELAKTMGIKLIATQIESEKQWELLKSMGINCFQGNFISTCALNNMSST